MSYTIQAYIEYDSHILHEEAEYHAKVQLCSSNDFLLFNLMGNDYKGNDILFDLRGLPENVNWVIKDDHDENYSDNRGSSWLYCDEFIKVNENGVKSAVD